MVGLSAASLSLGAIASSSLKTEKNKVSYAMGAMVSKSLKEAKIDINAEVFCKGFTDSQNCSGEGRGYKILEKPTIGSRKITFKIRLWNDPGLSTNFCNYWLNSIIIEGPSDAQWQNAFTHAHNCIHN